MVHLLCLQSHPGHEAKRLDGQKHQVTSAEKAIKTIRLVAHALVFSQVGQEQPHRKALKVPLR